MVPVIYFLEKSKKMTEREVVMIVGYDQEYAYNLVAAYFYISFIFSIVEVYLNLKDKIKTLGKRRLLHPKTLDE